ncbi:UNVERIFIED_CONTAM: Trimethyltridecatetraene synthase [Sesamum calycinum]|uniref:Trimethyltridecatetraene synthase n=1 Tax=Sesamum calycinum TaxID=2727403 RepID=A0AAW2QY71_9LAMI
MAFAARPALAAGKYTSYNYSDMVWAPYGPFWRQARKIYLTQVFSAKKLESFEDIRVEERRHFFSRLRSLSGKPVVLKDHLCRHMLSTITRMVLGSKYFSESGDDKSSIVKLDELKAMLDEWFLLNGVFNIGDWIPWLNFLDLQGYGRMKALYKRFDKFHNYQAEDSDLDVKLTRDHIKGLLQKAKEELDRVIGRNKWVEEDDFSKLPYINAVIMESMRLHPLGTFLIPHSAMEDCKVAGYDISKGTMILINTWSIGRDPNSWDAPEKFLPERFLGKETDILGSNFALLPFGSGRRRCPGYPLALKIVRTMLANLLHGFNLKLVDGMRPEDICMEETFGLATHPKKPLAIIMEPTLQTIFTELVMFEK